MDFWWIFGGFLVDSCKILSEFFSRILNGFHKDSCWILIGLLRPLFRDF